MVNHHFENLSVDEIIAFLFLIEEKKDISALARLISQSDFREKWEASRSSYRKLIQYYPDTDEEKHYLLATIEAVHGFDPYSADIVLRIEELKPIIKDLLS